MIRYSKLFLYLAIAMLLAWLLPWCWDFITARPLKTPFTLYSPVTGDFALIRTADNGALRTDRTGRTYTAAAFDSILPFFYYRQLAADHRFPDTIKGLPVTPQLARQENFMFRHTPTDINRITTPLYFLLESRSGRVDLEMPDDVFRLKNNIEFIDSKTNRTKKVKTERYQDIFRKKGFHFPARLIAGNPTTRKEYDEGYFITDAEHRLFHFKQMGGCPFLKKIDLPSGFRVKNLFVTEFRNRRTFAFLTGENDSLYTLRNPDYSLRTLPLPPFFPEKENLTITGNPLVWTLTVTGENGSRVYAVDAATYTLLDKMDFPLPETDYTDKTASFLFPFRLSFTSPLDKEVYPRLSDFSLHALLLNLLLAILFFFGRRGKIKNAPPQIIFILITGLYAWIGLLLFGNR